MYRLILILLVFIEMACSYKDVTFNLQTHLSRDELPSISMELAGGDLVIETEVKVVVEDGKVIDLTDGFKIPEGTCCVIESIAAKEKTITVNFGSNWCDNFYDDIKVRFVAMDGNSTWRRQEVGGQPVDTIKYRFLYQEMKGLPRKIKIHGKWPYVAE